MNGRNTVVAYNEGFLNDVQLSENTLTAPSPAATLTAHVRIGEGRRSNLNDAKHLRRPRIVHPYIPVGRG